MKASNCEVCLMVSKCVDVGNAERLVDYIR